MIQFNQIMVGPLFSYQPLAATSSAALQVQSFSDAGKVLQEFLDRYSARRGQIQPGVVTCRDLVSENYPEPEITIFAAHHDTLLFTEVIRQMLTIAGAGGIDEIHDLGAGSSIPTIAPLLERPDMPIRVTAVDIDADALAISRRNALKYGFADRYTYIQSDMLEYLRNMQLTARMAVAANPPYLPVPQGVRDTSFVSVDGGIDGTKYIEAVLGHPFPVGTYLALEWSSLSNPAFIIAIIERSFEVLYAQAIDIPYGIYTEREPLKRHIVEQYSAGKAAIARDSAGRIGWSFVGTVLRKK